MWDSADDAAASVDRCMSRIPTSSEDCPILPPNARSETMADLFIGKGYAPILERILHFADYRDVLSVAWTCKAAYTTVCSSVRIQVDLQKWAHDLPPDHHFPRPLRELERVLRWQTHLSRLLPQRVDSFLLPESSAMPKLRHGYALIPKRADGSPGWPTGCDVIQLPRSGESLIEERVAHAAYLKSKAEAEAGERDEPPSWNPRNVWRIDFPNETMVVDFDPESNLLVLAETVHLNRSSLPHKTFSALRIHFYRLDPTGSPTGNRSHPEAKHPRLDIATEAFLHPNRPLRKPRIHIGRNGLMCVTLRDWNGSSCTMVVNWKEATMYGATWHDNVMSWHFLDDKTIIGVAIERSFEIFNTENQPLLPTSSRVPGGRAVSRHGAVLNEEDQQSTIPAEGPSTEPHTPPTTTTSLPSSPASSHSSSPDVFYDALEDLLADAIAEHDDAPSSQSSGNSNTTSAKPEWLALVARSFGEPLPASAIGTLCNQSPCMGWVMEEVYPLGTQTVLRLPKLRAVGPIHPTDGPSTFQLTGALIELDHCPRPTDPGLLLISCWGQLLYQGTGTLHRHRGASGVVPTLHLVDVIAKHKGELVPWEQWGDRMTLQAGSNMYESIGTNKIFSIEAEPLPTDPTVHKRRARAMMIDFSPLAVHRQGQVVSRSLGSIGHISPNEIDSDVSSVLLHSYEDPALANEDQDKLCDGHHGLSDARACPPASPPVMYRDSLKGATCTMGTTLMDSVFEEPIVASGMPFSMRCQEMEIDAGHVMEDIWFDGERLVLTYDGHSDVLRALSSCLEGTTWKGIVEGPLTGCHLRRSDWE